MSERGVTESVVELAALAWFESAGWAVRNGTEIAPNEPAAERASYEQVVLEQRLRDTLAQLNPDLPTEALEDAFRKLTRPVGAEPAARNRGMHRQLVEGVTVEYRTAAGDIRGAQARVIDFDRVDADDGLAVNQFSVMETKHSRRPDVGCSSTACRWWCWSLKTRPRRTPRSGPLSRSFKPIRPRFRLFSPRMLYS
jgi:type I restriction enzyme R subunit